MMARTIETSTGVDWWRNACVYQVNLRSFKDADGDGNGDINGLREELGHIAALGCDAIWLNPIFRSPQRDHGYDIADYRDIDPMYGTLEDFDRLLEDLGIQPHTPHECRHSTATLLAEAGVQPAIIQSVMRHTRYSQSAEYTHIGRKAKIDALNVI